jgi:phenylacetyl-CoA:acceptor oxidoreductase 26-kDa subunit
MKRPNVNASELFAPKQQRNWDWRAATNFITGGAGGGLLFVSAWASLGAGDVRVPIFLALVLVATGLISVWFEIGRPWRALKVFRHLSSSWMAREATVAPLLFIAGALALWSNQHALIWLAGLFGAAFLYSQARMLTSNKGIPAWRHPRCLPVMLSTGLTEGVGILAMALPLSLATFSWALPAALLALLLARGICWRTYLTGVRADGAPHGTLRVLQAIDVPFVAMGHVVPAALIVATWAITPGGAGTIRSRIMIVAAGFLTVAAGWVLKYTMIRRAAYTQGFALQHLPVRGRRMVDLGTKPGWSRVDQKRSSEVAS